MAAKYLRDDEGLLLLREQENGDCVFYEEGRCRIHPVKPEQCRLYPFWFANVRGAAAWERTCRECPGIGEGPVVSPAAILAQVQRDLERQSEG